MTERNPVIEIKNLQKSFGKVEVLKGIDMEVSAGEVVAIIGSSGSGKTTLLRCINALETADGGEIYVEGNKIFDATLHGGQKKMKNN